MDQPGISSKIRHTEGGLGRPVEITPGASPQRPAASSGNPAAPNPAGPGAMPRMNLTPGGAAPPSKEIRVFESTVSAHTETGWKLPTHSTGTGARHVKTFHSKLTEDALHYMDTLINEWMDAHPECEVKFVTNSIGTFTGKLKEPHLVCQIWV